MSPEELQEHHLGLVREAARIEILAGMAVGLAGGGLAATVLSPLQAGAWLLLTLLLYGLRLLVPRLLPAEPGDAAGHGRQLILHLLGALLTGLCWAAGIGALLLHGAPLQGGVMLFLYAMLSLLALVTYNGLMPMVPALSLSGLLPAGAVALSRGDTASLLTGAMAILFALVLTGLSLLARRRLLASWETEDQVRELREMLDARRTQIDKLTVSLKTNMEKRELAEAELRRTSADLGLVTGKAKALADALQRVSPHDPVTGIANERHFDECLETEWGRAIRDRKPITLIALQIDAFEEFEEAHGTQSVDSALIRIAKLLSASGRRGGDLAARIEDGRFNLLLPGADSKNAARIAENIRKHVLNFKIPNRGAPMSGVLSVSVGVATMIPNRQVGTKELAKRAANALYEASFRGGNTTVVYRAMSDMRLERWDARSEGALSEAGMAQKFAIWGYKYERKAYPVGTYISDETLEEDGLIAVLSGRIQLTIESEPVSLKAGDALFLPRGTTRSLEVVGDKPALCLVGQKKD